MSSATDRNATIAIGHSMRPQTTIDSIDEYVFEMQTALADMPRPAVMMTISRLYDAWEQRKQVFVIGNGGSASTASHIANDLSKATIVPGAHRMKVMSLTDNVALMSAWANDTSYDAIFKEQLENLLEPGDTVLAISASGNSPNILRAIEFARHRGAFTIAWTGLSGGQLRNTADLCVHAPTEDIGMIESVHVVIDHLVTRQLFQSIQARTAAQATTRQPAEKDLAATAVSRS
jgi:D-sedoheptulose 7-phosphate isomerase